MIPSFVIYLREGIEASMIIAILLASLDRIGRRDRFRDVYVGVGCALLLILIGGVGAYLFIHHYVGSTAQTYFETVTYFVAAVVLTSMTFWMHKHARTLSADLRERSEVALGSGSKFSLAALAFQAVGREGLETMVFTLAIVFAGSNHQAAPAQGHLVLLGGVIGLAVAGVVGVLVFKVGAKLNLKVFFRVLGVTLMLFAAGLLADVVENLQQLGWLPVGTHVMWNTSGAITEGSNVGDLLHSLIGYADQPTVLQGLVWFIYVVVSVAVFVSLGRPKRRHLA